MISETGPGREPIDRFYGDIQKMLQPMFSEFQTAQVKLLAESIGKLDELVLQSPQSSPLTLTRMVLRHCDETTSRVAENIEKKVVASLREHLRLDTAALDVVGRYVRFHCSQLARETESALLGVVVSHARDIAGAQARWSSSRH